VPNRIFIDTLFVIALINPRDQYHARAIEVASKYESHPFLVTDVELLEIGNGLARSFKQEAIQVIESFFDSEEVDSSSHTRIIRARLRSLQELQR